MLCRAAPPRPAPSRPVPSRPVPGEQQTSSAARGPNVQPKKSKKKKKTKASAANAKASVSASSPDVDLAPAAAAAPLAAPTPAKEVEQPTLASSSTAVNGHHSHHSDLVNDHDGGHSPAHHSVDDLVMDHSDIKKWVMSVAACETVATLPEIRRYFHGRVEKDSCSVPLSPTNPLYSAVFGERDGG